MIVFPAVDIKDGKCVRLQQGLEDQVTIFGQDPVAMACHWADQGAQWLHVIDLDGAFAGRPANFELIREICAQVEIPVQLGGGIRDLETARAYFAAGIRRIIIGTLALEDPRSFGRLSQEFPGQVGVSLDAVDGQLKSRGWVKDVRKRVEDVLPELTDLGAAFIIYTDISRDGMQSGVNVRAIDQLLQLTELPVIAAGGVHSLADIQTLYPLSLKGLSGVITGKAIYTGTLDLKVALEWLARQEKNKKGSSAS